MAISIKAALAAPLLLSAAPLEHGPIFSGMPPERFRGDFAAITIFTADVARYCGEPGPGRIIYGCHKTVNGAPVIVLYNPCPSGDGELFARIACHEGAHSRGWGGNHEF